jgi:hypothetical protein
MASTPIYNWPTPDNTDLVKNGALAIRTLGDAIDTTMDTMIPETIFAAKGDLLGASANDTPAVLTVGANGETLVADSSTSTGLRYQSAYNGNGIINGGLDIWQRGTSFALTSPSVAYTADRWLGRHFGTNVTYSQQTSGLTGIQYSLRIQRPNGTTGLNEQAVYYQFETADSYRFAGQTVTLSFWAKAGANFSATSGSMIPYLITGTGTNQNITSGAYTGQATVSSTPVTLTTSWQRFSVTGTIASTATQIALIFVSIPTGTAGANDWFEITGAQLELGSVATSFKRSAGGTIQGELAACQRYYWRGGGDSLYQSFATGFAESATVILYNIVNPVPMRVAPTSMEYSSIANIGAGIVGITSAFTLEHKGKTSSLLRWGGASGATASQAFGLIANNSTSAYIGFNAEL